MLHSPVSQIDTTRSTIGPAMDPPRRGPEADLWRSSPGNQAGLRMTQTRSTHSPSAGLRPSQSPTLQRSCSCGGKAGGECAECKKKAEAKSALHSPPAGPVNGADPLKEDDLNKSADAVNTPAATSTPWVVGPPLKAGPDAYVNAQEGGLPAPTATPWFIGDPIAVANTTICDGSGGITYQANNIGNAAQTACLQNCVNVHEASHAADARADGAAVCTGKAAGATVRPPNETVRKATEIRASQAEIDCLNAQLPGSAAPCTDIITARITQMIAYRDSFR